MTSVCLYIRVDWAAAVLLLLLLLLLRRSRPTAREVFAITGDALRCFLLREYRTFAPRTCPPPEIKHRGICHSGHNSDPDRKKTDVHGGSFQGQVYAWEANVRPSNVLASDARTFTV